MSDGHAFRDRTLSPTEEWRVNQVCDRFEAAWKTAGSTGQRPRIEDYLGDPQQPEHAVLLRELVALDVHSRRQAGERPTPADYQERFPALDRGGLAGLCGHGPAEPETVDLPGQPTRQAHCGPLPEVIGKYRVVECLGQGGQADVFRAVHPNLPGRDVVIKWARRALSASHQQHLLEEGRVLAHLDHPGLVRVYDVDVHEGRPFVVLEHVAGRSLREQLKAEPLPSPRQAVALVAELARTLDAVHRQGVLHRDLKPANILIDRAGRPRLLDFGLAWLAQPWSEAQRRDGEVSGTFNYMAPEQANGDTAAIGPRADVFGLGAVLYELLTGRPPYQAATVAAVWEQARQAKVVPPRQLNPHIPRPLERICRKALAADPAQRYPTAGHLEHALRRWQRRRQLGWLVAAAAVLAVLGMATAWYIGSRPPVVSAPSLKGWIDLRAWEPGNPRRRDRRLNQQGALPLKPGDLVRIEARLNRPAYLYVLHFDTEGRAVPVYPWKPGDWADRPPDERPVNRLSLPDDPEGGWEVEAGPPGMETLVLLARETPLPPEVDAAALLAGLPRQREQNLQAVVYFENGDVVRDEPERAFTSFNVHKIDDPVLQMQALLKLKLQPHFAYSRAVSYACQGK